MMAFIYCRKCDWQQDDFWSWRYNPVSCFWKFGVREYWRPRRIQFDDYAAKDYGWKRSDPHSWYLIWDSLKRNIRKFWRMKWTTWKRFERANRSPEKWPLCPECKADALMAD